MDWKRFIPWDTENRIDRYELKQSEPEPHKHLKKPDCNCEKESDTDYVTGESISVIEMFQEYCKERNITMEKWCSVNTGIITFKFNYRIEGYDIMFSYEIGSQSTFNKTACLSCKTCMGWSRGSWTRIPMHCTPKEYVEKVFRDNEKSQRKEIDRFKIAAEICGK